MTLKDYNQLQARMFKELDIECTASNIIQFSRLCSALSYARGCNDVINASHIIRSILEINMNRFVK